KPIADFYEAENQDLVRLDTSGTPFAYVSQDSIFMKPGDFKWWLFLDTWVGELRSGIRYEKYVEWYRKWLKKDPPPQRFYDYNKYGGAVRSTFHRAADSCAARWRRGYGRARRSNDGDLPRLGPPCRTRQWGARTARLDRRWLHSAGAQYAIADPVVSRLFRL